MQSCNWIMILSLTLLTSTIMQRMWGQQKRKLTKNGQCAQNFGPAITKSKGTPTNVIRFNWISVLQIKMKRTSTYTYRKQKFHMPQRTARNTKALAKSCSYVVPPLSSAPWAARLEETMKAVIYWKGMRNTIQSKTKSCRTCQLNKKRTQKYGHLPPKIVISTPCEDLCVNLVGTHLKVKTACQ